MKTIEVPLNIGIRGDVKIQLRNVKTGEIEDEREGRNFLTNDYLNDLFTGDNPTMTWGGGANQLLRSCGIGSDMTPRTVTDTALGTEIGTYILSTAGTQPPEFTLTKSDTGVHPVWMEQKFLFPAHPDWTGLVTAIALRKAGNNAPIAFRNFSLAINKTDVHELIVTWRITLAFSSREVSNVITAGQRDGTTDVTCRTTINDAQLMTWVQRAADQRVSGSSSSNNNPMYCLWNTAHRYILTGEGNGVSDLANDGLYTIKGSELHSGLTTVARIVGAYTTGSFERESTIILTNGQSTGSIGEFVLGTHTLSTKSTANSYGTLFRTTFDPPLDKHADWQLGIKYKVKITEG